MTLVFDTANYAVSRDKIGHWILQHKSSGRSVYLQGDDARQFSREIERVPSRVLDLAIDEYCEVRS